MARSVERGTVLLDWTSGRLRVVVEVLRISSPRLAAALHSFPNSALMQLLLLLAAAEAPSQCIYGIWIIRNYLY